MNVRRALRVVAGFFAAPLLFGCNEQTVEVELHSLQASGKVAFVCRDSDGRGADRSLCPDYVGDDTDYRLYALVTQTSTEEVAVIDTFEAKVVDTEPSVPGYSFLRVPARPGAIASSPGGAATFVGIEGPDGKTGITAITTSCIGKPKEGETARDVTSFPSCHLPVMPGDIAVIVAPPEADGTIRASCDPSSGPEEGNPPGSLRAECWADLTKEHEDSNENEVGPRGRRKLAVALPDRGEIVIIDAQWLVDQTPGSFKDCRIEATLPLTVDLGPAGTKQVLDDAPELVPPDGCVIGKPIAPPKPSSFLPRPAGFARSGDLLYVADQAAPVIHALDMSNPCAPQELPSLLPMSFKPERANETIVTSRIAASPLTPGGERFVYAVDELDDPSSLMVFDVSPGSTNRTPLVRPGSLLVPEPADRIQLGSPIIDVAFALRDLETTDPETGVAESGVLCDPDPAAEVDSPGALHRPTSDKSRGAQPRLLRGLFGLAMLKTGQVAIIDVDDFDAPCRRPTSTNPLDVPDFRGCVNDPELAEAREKYGIEPSDPVFYTSNASETGSATVTNEVTCSTVEPHRLRSALLGKSTPSDGVGAPALVAFPEFTQNSDAVDLPPESQPKLLAVPFDAPAGDQVPPDPLVYVGTTLHTKGSSTADLVTDPNTARVPSLTLPFTELRSHPAADTVTLTFEGALTGNFTSGSVVYTPGDVDDPMRIEDPAAQFCDRGVYDLEMLGKLGVEKFGIRDTAAARDAFARAHADAVEVTSELLPASDPYWISQRLIGTGEGQCGMDYGTCSDTFGTYERSDVLPSREFSVVKAYQDRLSVLPKGAETDEQRAQRSLRLECCFPQGIHYRVRTTNQWLLVGAASGLRNDVTARPETVDGRTHYRCDRDCDPVKTYYNPRVFEIASSTSCNTPFGPRCGVGDQRPGDVCVYDACDANDNVENGPCRRTDASLVLPGATAPTQPGGPPGPIEEGDVGALACIHSGLTSRFAVYRGLSPSQRGMAFAWQTSGGFRPLVSSIAAVSIIVSPMQVEYVPELQRIAIVDGAQLGLTLISLDSLRVEDPWPVY